MSEFTAVDRVAHAARCAADFIEQAVTQWVGSDEDERDVVVAEVREALDELDAYTVDDCRCSPWIGRPLKSCPVHGEKEETRE